MIIVINRINYQEQAAGEEPADVAGADDDSKGVVAPGSACRPVVDIGAVLENPRPLALQFRRDDGQRLSGCVE